MPAATVKKRNPDLELPPLPTTPRAVNQGEDPARPPIVEAMASFADAIPQMVEQAQAHVEQLTLDFESNTSHQKLEQSTVALKTIAKIPELNFNAGPIEAPLRSAAIPPASSVNLEPHVEAAINAALNDTALGDTLAAITPTEFRTHSKEVQTQWLIYHATRCVKEWRGEYQPNYAELAEELNRRCIPTARGKKWRSPSLYNGLGYWGWSINIISDKPARPNTSSYRLAQMSEASRLARGEQAEANVEDAGE